MSYFNNQFLRYFESLEKNNSTHWFDANRKWYEDEVKLPFYDFVDELILQLRSFDSQIRIEPEDAIFRINSDIRFSKEKNPYKPWMSANISALGKRGKDYPGFFIQLNHKSLILAGGVYNPDKSRIQQIREEIAASPDEFVQAVRDPSFTHFFGGIQTEYFKTIPEEFRSLGNEIPELYAKQFYYRLELPPSTITEKESISIIKSTYAQAARVHQFLVRACSP